MTAAPAASCRSGGIYDWAGLSSGNLESAGILLNQPVTLENN